MFNYNKFKELLKIGQQAEQEAIKRINKPVLITQNETNYKYILYDFMTDDNIKYEVKLDLQSTRTKNIFIEFIDGRGLKSGISTTEADNYIIVSSDIYYLINVNTLKEIIKNCKIARVKDGTKGYLLFIDVLINNSTII
jgi:hypothetical protein